MRLGSNGEVVEGGIRQARALFQHFMQLVYEGVGSERLTQGAIESNLTEAIGFRAEPGGGNGDDGDRGCRGIALEESSGIESIQYRQNQVEDDDVRLERRDDRHTFPAVGGDSDFEAGLFESDSEGRATRLIVLDEEYSFAGGAKAHRQRNLQRWIKINAWFPGYWSWAVFREYCK